ncbi:MAG: CpsB/CapC family capsule biosynthesis tyrosine phosphatase [Bacteroidota bacterium]|nr:CpsB/CapC family capsule biosynthesis tyrosine phosphatase [Bacteroidota bacterium]
MLSWFKSSKQKLDPISFSVLKTDMHSHLIPGIDDGAQDLDSSIKIIKELSSLGFTKLITTPHIMSDFYFNTEETITNGLLRLREELEKQNIDIEIAAAAEYYIDYEFEKKLSKEKLLTFGDNYLLVEFSFIEKPKNIFDIIFKLQIDGYKIVLAHPERYAFLQEKDLEDFQNRGVLLQMNLLSLIGYYSQPIKKQAEWLIDNQMISFVGTDCHNFNQSLLYEKCQKEKSWHNLIDSDMLLNNTL